MDSQHNNDRKKGRQPEPDGYVVTAVCRYLQLTIPDGNFPATEEALQAWLEERIRHLLDRDPHHLIQALYRIDVDEEMVRMAFSATASTPRLLSIYVLERIKMKAAYRQKYRATGKS